MDLSVITTKLGLESTATMEEIAAAISVLQDKTTKDTSIKRALTFNDILKKKYKLFEFTGAWLGAFSKPETTGVWFVWGNSGNGKTSFIISLINCLSVFDRVLFNSLEEGVKQTLQQGIIRANCTGMANKTRVVSESKEELIIRLNKRKSLRIVIIDSLQHFQISYKEYLELKKMFPDKLFIFISQADGKNPAGPVGKKIMYDADLKIWVEGFRAFSKGRYIGEKEYYTVSEERAAKYWG